VQLASAATVERSALSASVWGDDEPESGPGTLPETASRILTAIITADDRIDGGALARQLDTALAADGDDPDGDDWLAIRVDDSAPRSPLASYTHPVVVRAHTPDGRPVLVELSIEQGTLSALTVSVVDPDGPDDGAAADARETDGARPFTRVSSFGWNARTPLVSSDAPDGIGLEHWTAPRWSEIVLDGAELVVGFGDSARRLPFPPAA
ncbi:hypothetical protein, partial [Mycetocola reblochoni]